MFLQSSVQNGENMRLPIFETSELHYVVCHKTRHVNKLNVLSESNRTVVVTVKITAVQKLMIQS
jgi:hypothetical protein